MLTQELLLYLAMFVRTEPTLFNEMLRLRVGLIIRVMASELSRSIKCDGDVATEHLLNLSPFEMKNLLYHILSGKEFNMVSGVSGTFSVLSSKSSKVSKRSQIGTLLSRTGPSTSFSGSLVDADSNEDQNESDKQGQWIRRRRLDGALNRVPRGFYSRMWMLLERCPGLVIEGKLLPQNLTQEMTSGELKFALQVCKYCLA
jgi:phosphorylase kinase alpha/beta subunit